VLTQLLISVVHIEKMRSVADLTLGGQIIGRGVDWIITRPRDLSLFFNNQKIFLSLFLFVKE
jgi:hypothetical protein